MSEADDIRGFLQSQRAYAHFAADSITRGRADEALAALARLEAKRDEALASREHERLGHENTVRMLESYRVARDAAEAERDEAQQSAWRDSGPVYRVYRATRDVLLSSVGDHHGILYEAQAVVARLEEAEERSRSEQNSRIATEKQLLLLTEALSDFTEWFDAKYPFGQSKDLPGLFLYNIYDQARAALAAQAVDRTLEGEQ